MHSVYLSVLGRLVESQACSALSDAVCVPGTNLEDGSANSDNGGEESASIVGSTTGIIGIAVPAVLLVAAVAYAWHGKRIRKRAGYGTEEDVLGTDSEADLEAGLEADMLRGAGSFDKRSRRSVASVASLEANVALNSAKRDKRDEKRGRKAERPEPLNVQPAKPSKFKKQKKGLVSESGETPRENDSLSGKLTPSRWRSTAAYSPANDVGTPSSKNGPNWGEARQRGGKSRSHASKYEKARSASSADGSSTDGSSTNDSSTDGSSTDVASPNDSSDSDSDGDSEEEKEKEEEVPRKRQGHTSPRGAGPRSPRRIQGLSSPRKSEATSSWAKKRDSARSPRSAQSARSPRSAQSARSPRSAQSARSPRSERAARSPPSSTKRGRQSRK